METLSKNTTGGFCRLLVLLLLVPSALSGQNEEIKFGQHFDLGDGDHFRLPRGPCITALHQLWDTEGLFPSFLEAGDSSSSSTGARTTTISVSQLVEWTRRVQSLPVALGRHEYTLKLVLFLLSKQWVHAEVVGCGAGRTIFPYMDLRLAIVVRFRGEEAAPPQQRVLLPDFVDVGPIPQQRVLIPDFVNDVLTKVNWSDVRFSRSLFPPSTQSGRYYKNTACHPGGTQGFPPISELVSFTQGYGASFGQVLRQQGLLQGAHLMNMCRMEGRELNAFVLWTLAMNVELASDLNGLVGGQAGR